MLLWTLTASFAALYAFLGLRRLHGYAPRSIDLAFYQQMVWCLGHGFAPVSLADGAHPLSLHVMPVLAPIALLGRWLPIGDLLVCAHAIALSLAVPAAHRLGGWWGVGLCVLCPALTAQAGFDVHPDVWAFAPMLLAIALEREGRDRAALIAWLCAFACRESVPLLTLAYALCRYTEQPRYYRRLAVASATWGVVALGIFAFTGGGPGASVHAHLGAGSLLDRLVSPRVPLALLAWIAASGCLAVLRPRIAAAALVVFALDALSAVPTTLRLGSHYAALAFPFLLAASIGATDRLSDRTRQALRLIALASVAVAYVLRGDGPGAQRFVLDDRPPAAQRAHYDALLARLPPDASVAASLPLGPALAGRARIYRDVDPRAGLDDVVLVTNDPRSPAALYRVRGARWLAADAALGVAEAQPGIVRFARGSDRRAVPLALGWIAPTAVPPSRSPSGPGECVRFGVPIASAPPAGASIELRTPHGEIAPVSTGHGLWLPGLGEPGDLALARLCGPVGHLGPGSYAWRWRVSDAAGQAQSMSPWSPLQVP